MHFQNIVHLPSRETPIQEGLVRWLHPTRGPIAPSEFVPAAERSGAIHLLGQWALDQVCELATASTTSAAVNVSASELRNPGYVDRVREALARHQCPPERLVIEMTEAVYDHRDDQVLRTLEGLRALGIRIAIDDFGDGYASLRWLAKFPVETEAEVELLNAMGCKYVQGYYFDRPGPRGRDDAADQPKLSRS